MTGIASRSQLRMSFLRYALVTIPLILLLGVLSGRASGSGYGNPWFAALAKPELMPPGAAFAIVWPILYALMGAALAMILHARGARRRGAAIGLFAVQLALNLVWSPLFFAMHKVTAALAVIAMLMILVAATTYLFARTRMLAGLLLVPYLAWLCFAAYLNLEIARLNPDAEALVVEPGTTQIGL